MWSELCRLFRLSTMQTFEQHFLSQLQVYKELYDSQSPQKWEWPEDAEMIDEFRKLLVYRALRPDKLLLCVSKFVREYLGT